MCKWAAGPNGSMPRFCGPSLSPGMLTLESASHYAQRRPGWPHLPITPQIVSTGNRDFEKHMPGRTGRRARLSSESCPQRIRKSHFLHSAELMTKCPAHGSPCPSVCTQDPSLMTGGYLSSLGLGLRAQGYLSFSSQAPSPPPERWTQVLFVSGMKSSWFSSSHSEKGPSVATAGLAPLHATRMHMPLHVYTRLRIRSTGKGSRRSDP